MGSQGRYLGTPRRPLGLRARPRPTGSERKALSPQTVPDGGSVGPGGFRQDGGAAVGPAGIGDRRAAAGRGVVRRPAATAARARASRAHPPAPGARRGVRRARRAAQRIGACKRVSRGPARFSGEAATHGHRGFVMRGHGADSTSVEAPAQRKTAGRALARLWVSAAGRRTGPGESTTPQVVGRQPQGPGSSADWRATGHTPSAAPDGVGPAGGAAPPAGPTLCGGARSRPQPLTAPSRLAGRVVVGSSQRVRPGDRTPERAAAAACATPPAAACPGAPRSPRW